MNTISKFITDKWQIGHSHEKLARKNFHKSRRQITCLVIDHQYIVSKITIQLPSAADKILYTNFRSNSINFVSDRWL